MLMFDVQYLFLISMPGVGEWIIILIIVLLLFGANKIPGLARGLGRGMKEFRDAKDGKTEEPDTEHKKEEEKLK